MLIFIVIRISKMAITVLRKVKSHALLLFIAWIVLFMDLTE